MRIKPMSANDAVQIDEFVGDCDLIASIKCVEIWLATTVTPY